MFKFFKKEKEENENKQLDFEMELTAAVLASSDFAAAPPRIIKISGSISSKRRSTNGMQIPVS